MNTYTGARDALVSHFVTNWAATHPTVTVLYENQDEVSTDNLGNEVLVFSIVYLDTEQADMADAPLTKVYGQVLLTHHAKVGQGTRLGLDRLQSISDVFKYQVLSGVQVGAPSPSKKHQDRGWMCQDLVVPFHFFMS